MGGEIMKKLVAVLTVLLLVGSTAGFCTGTVDTFLDNRSKSDLTAVSDSAKVVNAVYKPASEAKDQILKPFDPVTKPVKDVAYKMVNEVYKVMTFAKYRAKK